MASSQGWAVIRGRGCSRHPRSATPTPQLTQGKGQGGRGQPDPTPLPYLMRGKLHRLLRDGGAPSWREVCADVQAGGTTRGSRAGTGTTHTFYPGTRALPAKSAGAPPDFAYERENAHKAPLWGLAELLGGGTGFLHVGGRVNERHARIGVAEYVLRRLDPRPRPQRRCLGMAELVRVPVGQAVPGAGVRDRVAVARRPVMLPPAQPRPHPRRRRPPLQPRPEYRPCPRPQVDDTRRRLVVLRLVRA